MTVRTCDGECPITLVSVTGPGATANSPSHTAKEHSECELSGL
jgi:hypothetical protein